MKIQILDHAKGDLIQGYRFHEALEAGLGGHFLEHLFADIESLADFDEPHPKPCRHFHRAISKRFPFALFYTVEDGVVKVQAVGVPPAVVMGALALQ
jgi:hypothetical protein